MKFKVIIKYVYSELSGKPTAPELNRIHQVNEHSLLTFLEDNDYIITREDLVTILKKDGADFHTDSIRIYDEKYKCYFQVPEDFELEIDPNQQSHVDMLLLIKSNTASYHQKVDELEVTLEEVKDDIERINAKIDSLLEMQKFLYENYKKSAQSQLMQLPSLQHSKSNKAVSNEVEIPEKPEENLPVEQEEENLDELEELELGPVVDLRKQNSVIKYIEGDGQLEDLEPRTLDIAIIYSEPLVRKVEKKYESLADPVDFEEECTKLLEILQAKKKKIDLIFEIASHDRLVSLLGKGPIILHIICHGEYDKERKQFYLCFEANNGELYEFYSENLLEIIRNVKLKIKLVIVNTCHSEEVANIFAQAGVPCVIAIQTELQSTDSVARKFSNIFYDQIFDGKSIKDAFELAKVASRSADIHTCCCAHPHKKDCNWYNYCAKIDGFQLAHQMHVPLCTDCPKRNQHIHKSECTWAKRFLIEFDPVCTNPNKDHKEIYFCCCSPELPHEGSLKFKNICTPDAEKMILFPQKEPGTVNIKNPYNVIEQKFPVKRIYGRNRELFQMYDYLIKQDQKFVQLNGSEGVGKTSLVKQLANYLYERGHFRDKISIIMMEKTPSISHFLADLYKEVPGAYDFKSFCESIKLSKILFILEKCDLLLENCKEEFVDHLRQISAAGKNVKFIIVKNKKERLHLDESEVMIEDLEPIDAAKILLASAFDYLYVEDKRLDLLSSRRLFQEIKFTPQRIWCIVERLKRFEQLEAIQAEFLSKKELYTSKDDSNKQDIIVTLETIKAVDQPCYELVLAVGLFPSGLSTDDLKELSYLAMVPENWKVIMKRLTRNPAEIKILNNDIEDQQALQEQWDNQTDYQLLTPGNYFWVVISKNAAKETLHYQPAQFVNKFIDSDLRAEVASLNFFKLRYLTLLSLSMIKRLKGLYAYHEKVIEHSCISNHGLWMYREDNIFYKGYIKDKRHYTYIDEFQEGPKALDANAIRKVFEAHESNFLSCLESETILSIIKSDGSLYGEVMDLIEIAWISIPTIYKLFAASQAGARDLCLRTLKMVDDLEYRELKLTILRAKLHLFLAALHLHDKSENMNTNAVENINHELDSVSKLQEEIEKDEVNMALNHHITFTKAYLFYKIRIGRFLQNEKPNKKKHFMKKSEEILQMIKQCDDFLGPLGEFYDVERCKLAILSSKIALRSLKTRRGIEVKITERIKQAIGVFNVYNLKRLEISANYQFAKIRFNLKKYNTSKADSTSRQIKLADSLTQAKNHYLIRNALQIVKLINDKAFERKIKRLVDEINTEIRQGYFNVLIFMRASPIVELQQKQLTQEQQKGDTETKAVGFPTRVAAFYKHKLLKALNYKMKTLYLKFEILTKANLVNALHNGCRIMQFNCSVVQSGGVVLEDSIGRTDFVPYSELKELFSSKQSTQLTPMQTTPNPTSTLTPQQSNPFASERFLELLILGSKNDFSTANFFADEIKIPHVIYFQFLNKEFDFRHKMYEDHCINTFCQFFLEDIVDGYTIREAFNRAYERTFDSLSEVFFESRGNTYIKNIIGEGPMILPENSDHSEVLYGVEDFTLNEGPIEDISTVRYPTNIPKTILPYTGRNGDMYAVAKMLVTLNMQFVKVTGEVGIGKTAFAVQTAHFLLSRKVFPAGIFYFPLKNLQNQGLKDMMQVTFGPKFENNMKNFFRESKMLLIFDDFDIYYTKGQEFPRLIFLTLRESGISTLVITTSRKKQETAAMKKKWQQEYDMRQKAIDDEFLCSERILKPMKDEEMAHILLSMAKIDKGMDVDMERIKTCQGIQLAEGNPRALINSLMEKKITIDKREFEINPSYSENVNLDQHLAASHQNPNTSTAKIGGLHRHNSNLSLSDSVRLSKMTSTASARTSNSRDSLPSLKLNHRTKSSTGQSNPGRQSQEERKVSDKMFSNGPPSIAEAQLERSHDRSDDDGIKSTKRVQKSKLTATKLRKEKSVGSNHEHVNEINKKDSSVSEERDKSFNRYGSHDFNAMDYYYEEQKSNDADELLREFGSNDDERDELYQIDYDEEDPAGEFQQRNSDSEDDELQYDDIDETGYFSNEEGSMRDPLLPQGIQRPSADRRQGQAHNTVSRNKAKHHTLKKKTTNQNQKTGDGKKKKGKGEKSGKQANRFTKSKKNKFIGKSELNQRQKRRESNCTEDED